MALWQHLEIFSLLVLLAHADTADTSSRKPLVRVFFGTGCPDSQNFIENSLRPVVEHLSNLVDIELYPWGKVNIASTSRHDTFAKLAAVKDINSHPELQKLHFSCQHGHKECEGNKLALCAISSAGGPANSVIAYPFIKCLMGVFWQKDKWPDCAKQTSPGAPSWDALNSCAHGSQGAKLFLEAGHTTATLNKKPFPYIPWVVIDGHHMHCKHGCDLLHLLCKVAEHARLAPHCAGLGEWEAKAKAAPFKVPCLNGDTEVPHGWRGASASDEHKGQSCECVLGWLKCAGDEADAGDHRSTDKQEQAVDYGLGRECTHIKCSMRKHHVSGKEEVVKRHVASAPKSEILHHMCLKHHATGECKCFCSPKINA